MTATPLRLFYVDDSGAEVTGFATFTWIELRVEDWKPGLRQVLNWRKRLMAEYQIPPLYELHATKFANGPGTLPWIRSGTERNPTVPWSLMTSSSS